MAQGDTLTLEEALALLNIRQEPDREVVHTFVDGGLALIGADWDLAELRREARQWPIKVAGPGATAMGHGVVIQRPDNEGGSVFLETK